MNAGVVVVAGGEATRLPGKLALDAGGVPLVVRTYRNVASGRETFISCKATFAPEVDALLDAPLVVDRWPGRGPLAALVTTMSRMRSPFVFAVAADSPFVESAFLRALEHELRDGDEAVVPAHGEGSTRRLEPLAALYDRLAFLREGLAELRRGGGAMVAVVARLRTRTIALSDRLAVTNVNTREDYLRMREAIGKCTRPA